MIKYISSDKYKRMCQFFFAGKKRRKWKKGNKLRIFILLDIVIEENDSFITTRSV
jgi:hypothetical protein